MSQTDPRAVARGHYGDPCVYCHAGHNDVAIGPCPRRKSGIVELTKLPNGYWGVLINKVTSFATIDLDAARCNFQRVDEAITHALADAERREAERCAKDVCMYCGGRALGHLPVIGPNQAGNYIHATPKATGEDVLCRASGIYSRLRAQAQADKEG